jgi:hypothetical protein
MLEAAEASVRAAAEEALKKTEELTAVKEAAGIAQTEAHARIATLEGRAAEAAATSERMAAEAATEVNKKPTHAYT